jgi:uncharacterized protein GlcG (DUF336 family)
MVRLEDARRVIATAEKEAKKIGQPMNIAVADAGGMLGLEALIFLLKRLTPAALLTSQRRIWRNTVNRATNFSVFTLPTTEKL